MSAHVNLLIATILASCHSPWKLKGSPEVPVAPRSFIVD